MNYKVKLKMNQLREKFQILYHEFWLRSGKNLQNFLYQNLNRLSPKNLLMI